MKFSKKWLDLFLETPLSTDELVKKLNSIGLEVDSVEPASDKLTGIQVAYVESTEKHPDADKLNVCQVKVSETDTVQVVCGAPNVRGGLKVAFAKVGVVLGEDFKIKVAKLRGVESNGMICSARELGLGDEHDGILELPDDAPLGMDIHEYLELPDDIVEIDLTPNRADCLSVIGVARDIAAATHSNFKNAVYPAVKSEIDDTLSVKIESEQNCLRYCGRIIKNIDLSKESPIWMVERLRRSGIRAINPVVDVTNYVLLELGQPMHGFDLSKLEGGIVVRQNHEKEKLTLLDESEVTTSVDTLMIADEKKPLALAGIMGGLESSVTDDTQDIFFESAAFAPLAIAGKARTYGMHTDSSHRFERGVSPEHALDAIEYATQLLIDITGGQPGPIVDEKSSAFPSELKQVELKYASVQRLLGVEIDKAVIEKILSGLQLSPEESANGWTVTVPAFRFDINIEADLIEEIARLYGFDNISSHAPMGILNGKAIPEVVVEQEQLLDHLKALGYSEIISYSFVEPKLHRHFAAADRVRKLINPISEDLSEMRVSLLPGLLQAVKHNQARQILSNRFFEMGLRFTVDGDHLLTQTPMVAAVLSGEIGADDWSQASRKVDFFDIKGDLEHLLGLTAKTFEFKKTQLSILHPGQGADVFDQDDRCVGYVGVLHPQVAKQLKLKGSVVVFELEQSVFKQAEMPRYQTISKFPHIRRDLAMIVDESVEVKDMIATISSASADLFDSCDVFDLYQGEGVAEGKKSIAFGIQLKSLDKTFTDEEVNGIITNILDKLKATHQAELRE